MKLINRRNLRPVHAQLFWSINVSRDVLRVKFVSLLFIVEEWWTAVHSKM